MQSCSDSTRGHHVKVYNKKNSVILINCLLIKSKHVCVSVFFFVFFLLYFTLPYLCVLLHATDLSSSAESFHH